MLQLNLREGLKTHHYADRYIQSCHDAGLIGDEEHAYLMLAVGRLCEFAQRDYDADLLRREREGHD
jgi:hypothetical protein